MLAVLIYAFTAGGFSAGTAFGAWWATRRREMWLRQHQPITAADLMRMLEGA